MPALYKYPTKEGPRWACQLKLKRIRFHDLRHTYASQLIQAGAHIKYIQGQLGHSSINVTLDIYGHLLGTERHVDRLESTVNAIDM